ncbi:MAG: hypothetical protein WA776_09530 [Xanthobacteraceae bacterium]
MGILLAYFVWVVGTLAVIATAWIGVADSDAARLHLQHAATIQRSYDASFIAEDSGNTPATASAKAAHAVARLPGRQRPSFNRRVALRANPPPFDGH